MKSTMTSRLLMSASIQGVCLFMMLGTGCRGPEAVVDGYVCADFIRSEMYYGRSVEVRLAEVRSYPIDKQYAVFICGVQHIRPPKWETAQPFASHGSTTAEFLIRKLPLVRDDTTVENIVTLVGDMEARGVYELTPNSELVRALELAVSRMKNQTQKKRVQDALGQLAGE